MFDDGDVPGPSEGGEHLPGAGVESAGHPDGVAPGLGDGKVDRLDAGGGAVVERCIGHCQPGDGRHHRLVLPQRLQHPLGDLALVRGVGGDELGPHGEGPHHRGQEVVVDPAPGKAHQIGRHLVPQPRDVGHHLRLGPPRRQAGVGSMAQFRRDVGEQVGGLVQPQGSQQSGDVAVGMWGEVHQRSRNGGSTRRPVYHSPRIPTSVSVTPSGGGGDT